MTNCWSEGSLRAYLDRELPVEDMKSVAAHLGECSTCDALCAVLAGRAARVFALLEALPEPERAARMRPAPAWTPSRWLWPGAAVALAAGLAIASFTLPKQSGPKREPVRLTEMPPPAAPISPEQRPEPVAMPAAEIARPVAARIRPQKKAAVKDMDYFVALDNEPIESGVIMRMAIQPGNAQADIVFDPGGRPRAIRLVNSKY
jgi:anti-sigma factor RsiW